MSRAELKQKGFTIIEVVLVLAIAALIFLMVFIALPALQRNQRDQARKTFQSKVSSAVTTYQSNKRGVSPTTGATLSGYFDGVAATATAESTDTDVVQMYTSAKCNTTGDQAVAGTNRQAAILMKMENGGSIVCQEV